MSKGRWGLTAAELSLSHLDCEANAGRRTGEGGRSRNDSSGGAARVRIGYGVMASLKGGQQWYGRLPAGLLTSHGARHDLEDQAHRQW